MLKCQLLHLRSFMRGMAIKNQKNGFFTIAVRKGMRYENTFELVLADN